MNQTMGILLLGIGFAVAGPLAAAEVAPPTPAAPAPGNEPIKRLYQGYKPDFIDQIARHSGYHGAATALVVPPEAMKLSSESSFYSLSLIDESDRAYALVAAAADKERTGQYREALEIYQKVLDEYDSALYRVSPHGVFAPIGQYCQLRILAMPREHIDFYRIKHDSRARESFEMSRQRNSLEGLAEIRDRMLCTSFGGPALVTLGMSALDRGHYLEALEYFDQAWETFPEPAVRTPQVAMSMDLCRKMLATGEAAGAARGLIGHWKLDERSGRQAADSSGFDHHGAVAGVPAWTPAKLGGGLRFDMTNGVNVPARSSLNIGEGGTDFSVAFWLSWEHAAPFFVKSAGGENHLSLGLDWRTKRLQYELATESDQWETGQSKTPVPPFVWTHVTFVKDGKEVRIHLNGKLDARAPLKAPVLRNAGGIALGQHVRATLDDVRLYGRALLNREAAELAGVLGSAELTASPSAGEVPFTVEFSAPPAGSVPGAQCSWEFGDGQSATGPRVRHTYTSGGNHAAILTLTDPAGVVTAARRTIAARWGAGDSEFTRRMSGVIEQAGGEREPPRSQLAGAPNVAADDYTLFPPTDDPLALKDPVWREALPASRGDFIVFSQPVITDRSVIYRHKNIVYCRSILNGELRWQNDLGGRVTWQSIRERQYPMEDILVKDGLVFAPMQKVGPSLVALDEITGQLRWAYGPMVAGNEEESRLRFESAPAAGPQAVYAGYILDNIEGETHTDTEYGVMAFEAATGRVIWQTRLARLRPGKFSAGFAASRRNKIRSFSSPPLYHEGTVYYNSNAGVITAVDALSGRVKWLMRYPYYPSVHDATAPFGGIFYEGSGNPWRPHSPMFWFNQRPLLMGDRLIALPVDTRFMLCLDRKTGKVEWSAFHPDAYVFMAGPTSDGLLALAQTARANHRGAITLVDPAKQGRVVWQSPPLILHDTQPVMKYTGQYLREIGTGGPGMGFNDWWAFYPGARPFLSTDGKISVTSWIEAQQYGIYPPWCHHLAELSLDDRRVTARRRYYSSQLQSHVANLIAGMPERLRQLEATPNPSKDVREWIPRFREVASDRPPGNKYGPFHSFTRMTFDRLGVRFELRFGPQELAMVYDTDRLSTSLAARADVDAEFAKAEIAVNNARHDEAAQRLVRCLELISPEDVLYRTQVNQQLYAVRKKIARLAMDSGRLDKELAQAAGMSQAVTQLGDEIESLFVLAEANERKGNPLPASRQLQSLVENYGPCEFRTTSLLAGDPEALVRTARTWLESADTFPAATLHGPAARRALELTRRSIPGYFTTLSPVSKDLVRRAEDVAVGRLLRLQKAFPPFAKEFSQAAAETLEGKPADEQFHRIRAYPGTPAAQTTLEALLKSAGERERAPEIRLELQAEARRRLWALADLARVCGLDLPAAYRRRLLAPVEPPPSLPLKTPLVDQTANLEEERSPAWRALERKGRADIEPELLFLGARVRKKLDNKFLLYARDLASGTIRWKAREPRGDQWFDEIRLGMKGDEPGFPEAFVHGDLVVVYGMTDVLAFNVKDGALRWRYVTPQAFTIQHAAISGDLLALQGKAETLVLYLPTRDPRGEVVWQEKEEGDLYSPSYFAGDRLIEVRKMPFNVTVRYRGTGKLMGRLLLPDLQLFDGHPLQDDGPRALPVAHDGSRLVLSDGLYYLMVDVDRMKLDWKRLIDANDPTRTPPLRFELKGDYLAVVKQDFDVKALHMLSSRTGDVLWKTDPKVPGSQQPLDSMLIHEEALYGIKSHLGQGFYFAGIDCRTGKDLFPPNEQKGYEGKPEVRLRRQIHGPALVAQIKDRQDFQLKAFDTAAGKLLHTIQVKAAGDFGDPGNASATVQNGKLILLGRNELVTAAAKQ